MYLYAYIYEKGDSYIHGRRQKLHTLLVSHLYSRSDSLYIYVSLLLCRWVAESVYSFCLRACMRVPSFSWYICMCIHTYVHKKDSYIHGRRQKLHTLSVSHLHSKRDTNMYKESFLLCRWLTKSVYSVCRQPYM